MNLIVEFCVVFLICMAGEWISALLPFTLPASVISLLLLLGLLLIRAVRVDHVREKADFLLGNLGFFFVPVSVSIMNYAGLIRQHAAAFVTICVVSTVLTYGATTAAVRLTVRLMRRREEARP